MQQLRQWIVAQAELRIARLVGWAMVNRAGSHHPRHHHPIAILSGVYYVTAGSPEALRDLCAEAGVPEATAGPMLRAIADAMDEQPSGGAR